MSRSPGCLAIVASVLIFLALTGITRGCIALLNHQAFYWTQVGLNPTWISPWQGIATFLLILGWAVHLLVSAIRGWKK
jgi:hypothetical protein